MKPSDKKLLVIIALCVLGFFAFMASFILAFFMTNHDLRSSAWFSGGVSRRPSPTAIVYPSGKVVPTEILGEGCFYKQVQCIKAPCPPILVCPTIDRIPATSGTPVPSITRAPQASSTPEPTQLPTKPSTTPTGQPKLSCNWCGNSCVADAHRMMCPQISAPIGYSCKQIQILGENASKCMAIKEIQ